jgi:hypothetical protein
MSREHMFSYSPTGTSTSTSTASTGSTAGDAEDGKMQGATLQHVASTA